MALFEIAFRSSALGKAARARVIIPDGARPPYPVLYLLHGLSDDESQWTRATRLEEYAERHPFLIVMPDGARGFYCDSPLGSYETYLRDELVEKIDGWFPTRREARGRAIGGLSMGGYGAIKMALKYPGRYGAAFSHSGAVNFERLMKEIADDRNAPADLALLASTCSVPDNDPMELARRLAPDKAPALYLDCGKDDFLFRDNEDFHARLFALGITHHYFIHPGTHCWAYWDEHIQESLRFAAAAVR